MTENEMKVCYNTNWEKTREEVGGKLLVNSLICIEIKVKCSLHIN